MHPASSGVANIRWLWCPGNISQAERSFGGRRSMARSRNVAAGCGVMQRFAQSAEEVAMTSYVRPACLALAFVATAVPASAQTWFYEPDVPRARVYEPRYEPRSYYEPGAYQPPTYESRAYEPRAYEPVVNAPPLALTPAQRTTIYRTIIPQGRGRGPIVRERIVTEPVAPAPVVRERIVNPPRRLRLCLCRRLAGRRCLRARPDAPGSGRHGAGRTLVPVHGHQQPPAAGRSRDRHRRRRGQRLARRRPRHELAIRSSRESGPRDARVAGTPLRGPRAPARGSGFPA